MDGRTAKLSVLITTLTSCALSPPHSESFKQVNNEVKILSRLQHPNIVACAAATMRGRAAHRGCREVAAAINT